MVGNFIADSVKGNASLGFSTEVQKGIKLHREIDHFTDTHLITSVSKERLRVRYKKYAPVITDIFYDHFLALYWQDYSDKSLTLFTQEVYGYLGQQYHTFPEKSKQFYQYMIRYDILNAYAKIEGIKQVMSGMAKRTAYISGMETATEELLSAYAAYEYEFRVFFPDLQAHVSQWNKIHGNVYF